MPAGWWFVSVDLGKRLEYPACRYLADSISHSHDWLSRRESYEYKYEFAQNSFCPTKL